MLPERYRKSSEELRSLIDNPENTSHLMQTAEEILEGIEGKEILTGITSGKIFESPEGIKFRSIRGESIGFKVLTIWRFFEVFRGDSITFMVGRDSLGFAGLSYFAEGERKKIVRVIKDEKELEQSWTVDPQEPVVEESALPKAKEILHALLDIRDKQR